MKKSKFYAVWNGVNPGVYDNWTDCQLQTKGFEGAKYKSFETRDAAVKALDMGYDNYKRYEASIQKLSPDKKSSSGLSLIKESICVDAACSGNPGNMEYRGVYTRTGQQIFHIGPLAKGTNNIGEFLALVHGLALLKQKECDFPIYTDSRNAMIWVKNKKCKTLLERVPENEKIFELIERAEKWLKTNTYTTQIIKWPTEDWGEIPADFGRK